MRLRRALLALLGLSAAACTPSEPLQGPLTIAGDFDVEQAISNLRDAGFAVDPASQGASATRAIAAADLTAACPTRLIRDPNPGDNARRARFTDAENGTVVATVSRGRIRLEGEGRYRNHYINRFETYPCDVPPALEQQLRAAIG